MPCGFSELNQRNVEISLRHHHTRFPTPFQVFCTSKLRYNRTTLYKLSLPNFASECLECTQCWITNLIGNMVPMILKVPKVSVLSSGILASLMLPAQAFMTTRSTCLEGGPASPNLVQQYRMNSVPREWDWLTRFYSKNGAEETQSHYRKN